jgi:hypothetical protein
MDEDEEGDDEGRSGVHGRDVRHTSAHTQSARLTLLYLHTKTEDASH